MAIMDQLALAMPMPMLLSTDSSSAAAILLFLLSVATLVALTLNHLLSSRRRSPSPSPRPPPPPPPPLPPSPPRLLVIGHLHLLHPPVHRTFHDLSTRLGSPLIHIRLGPTHCVVAGSAAVARELIRDHDVAISARPISALSRLFSYGSSGFAFTPNGPHWRFLRKLCVSEVLGARTVQQLRHVRRRSLLSLLRSVLASAERSGEAVDLTRELIRFANTSIIGMVASDVAGGVTDEAGELVKQVTELLGAFNLEDYVPLCRGWDLQGLRRKATVVHRRFDAVLEQMIRHKEEARREKKKVEASVAAAATTTCKQQRNKDLLDILLDKAEDETAELKLTRENMKAFIIDVVTAGSDSSAATVEWMLAELLNHPEALTKVRAEIDAVIGGEDRCRIVDETDLPRLPYLQAAFKETLRLHPGAPIAHRQSSSSNQPMVVRGFTVPPGTAVYINLWAIGRDPSVWEDPLEFRPERFLPGGAAEGLEPRGGRGEHQFQFMPFGAGRRGCPGMGLAQQSVPAVLAALVQCFDWAVDDGETTAVGNGIGMDESDVGLVCARKHPLVLRPIARLNPFPAIV